MRFAGAVSVLALFAGSTAMAQSTPDQEQRITELQKQLDAIAAQLRELQQQPASDTGSLESRLDGAVRQSPSEALREPRRLNISAPGIEGLDITGYLHVRGEGWGNYDVGSGNGDGLAFGTEAAIAFDAKLSEKTHVYIEPQGIFAWGDSTMTGIGGPSGTTNTTSANFSEVRLVAARLGVHDLYGTGWDMDVGRQAIELGDERIIGDDEWVFWRTYFDGFRFDRNLGDPGNVTLLAVRVQDAGHFPATNTTLTPINSPADDQANLFALYYSSNRNDTCGQFDGYIFQLEDSNAANGSTIQDRTRWTTYGARWASANYGGLTFDAEAVTQFGEFNGQKTGSHDRGFDIWAGHAGANFRPDTDIEYFDGFFAAYDYASGGDNVSDQESFVQLYPTLHGWFGLTDLFSWSNIQHVVLGVNFLLHEGTLSFAYHFNDLASSSGTVMGYNSGGSLSSTDGRDLGQEADVTYSVQCSKSTDVSLGAGFFMPGDAYTSATNDNNDNIKFGYLQFRARF